MNVRFEYLYRDAGNFKRWGEVVFSNTNNIGQETLDRLSRSALPLDELYFLPDKVGVPSLHFESSVNDLDHCWHEIHAFELCENAPDDPCHRDVERFIGLVIRRQNLLRNGPNV